MAREAKNACGITQSVPIMKSLLDTALEVANGANSLAKVAKTCMNRARNLQHLNAYVLFDESAVMRQAEKLDKTHGNSNSVLQLSGIISIKDNINVEGGRTSAGSKMLDQYISPYDATAVTRLRSGGALIGGKCNMDEFGMGSATLYSAYGGTVNPYTFTHDEGANATPLSAGGSSGGGAAAVAAMTCHASLGSDTGGSVRQPAAWCGIVGLKPSYGAISRHGLISYGSSLDTIGIMAKSVLDASLVFDCISGADEHDNTTLGTYTADLHGTAAPIKILPQLFGEDLLGISAVKQLQRIKDCSQLEMHLSGMVIGVPKQFSVFEMTDSIRNEWEESLSVLQAAGAKIEIVDIPSLKLAIPCYYTIACAEASSNLSRYDGLRYGYRHDNNYSTDTSSSAMMSLHEEIAASRGAAFGSEVIKRILTGTFVLSQNAYHEYYETAMKVRSAIIAEMNTCLETVHCLFGPTAPVLPFAVSNPPSFGEMLHNDIMTTAVNLAGLPAVNVPVNITEHAGYKVPIGMQCIGRRCGEGDMMKIALALEQRVDFETKRPDYLQYKNS